MGDIRSGHRNSAEKSEKANVEDAVSVYEEITTMKTEVMEEFYDLQASDGAESGDAKVIRTSEYLQPVKDEVGTSSGIVYNVKQSPSGYPATSPYVETLEKDCYKQHVVWCEEKDLGLSEEDVGTKTKKKYVCDKCSYGTTDSGSFLKHVSVHSNTKPFKCETCGSSFKRKDVLKRHAEIHDKEREKVACCPYCNQTFYRNTSLKRHIDIKHVYKNCYKCGFCEYTSPYKADLKRHELFLHSGADKMYKCKYCEYSTHYKRNLEDHERRHLSKALLKCPYKSSTCGQQCVGKSCACDGCPYETANRTCLSRHILVKHSGKPKEHVCTICTYSTHIKAKLMKHMRTHTKNKPPLNKSTTEKKY